MNFDSLMMAAVCHELQNETVPGKVERVLQPSPLEVVIQIFAHGRKHALLIALDAMAARIHLTEAQRANPPSPPAFCMLLRKYLGGAWLEGVEQPSGPGERVMCLTFLCPDGARRSLYAEIMAKHSNLILVTDAQMILGAVKTITIQVSRFREVRSGIKYFGPPRMKGAKRDAFAGDAAIGLPLQAIDDMESGVRWLLDTFSGISPLMAREAVARASGKPLTTETVWFSLNELLNCARLGEYAPVQYLEPDSIERCAYPVPLASVPPDRQTRWTKFNPALDDAAAKNAVVEAFLRDRTATLGALKRALKTCERELIDNREGLDNAARADEYKTIGDLILSRVHQIPIGASETVIDDYFAQEGPVRRTVALDPTMSASDNAKRYYGRYKKARASAERLAERQTELERTAREIEWAIEEAEKAETAQELRSLSMRMGEEVARRLKQPGLTEAKPAARETPEFAGHKIRRYRSVDGWEILVGENATSNDYLTTRIASPNDIWLHARALPSAHAVIRSQNRPATVSLAAIKLAAEQVARRSDSRHARLTPVDYTLKKYVRKPRGAAPGAVTYSHEKTLDVEPAAE